VCYFFYYSSSDFHELAYVQGSGKTTLLKAILNKSKPSTAAYDDAVSDIDMHEVIADGLCYCDSVGINMQVFSFHPFFVCFSLKSGLCFKYLVIFKILLVFMEESRGYSSSQVSFSFSET
jgi:hypothetical protein